MSQESRRVWHLVQVHPNEYEVLDSYATEEAAYASMMQRTSWARLATTHIPAGDRAKVYHFGGDNFRYEEFYITDDLALVAGALRVQYEMRSRTT